jgi:hypothetical protein
MLNKLKINVARAEAQLIFVAFAARLSSCPGYKATAQPENKSGRKKLVFTGGYLLLWKRAFMFASRYTYTMTS